MGMKAEEVLAIAIAKIKSGGGTGGGDMNKSDYDPNSVVREAGGIEEFVNGIGTNKANESTISRVENGNTASTKIDKDEQFYHNNVLYTATSDIAQGGNIVTSGAGQNCVVSPSITSQIAQKADKSSLGTASAKNAISVVTDSTDLVESGAVKDIVGWGNKNLLPNNLESTTKNTVVITVNNDKSVKLNGTATSNANVALCDLTNSDLPSGNYILSSVLNSNNKFIKAEAYNGSTFVSTLATTQSGDNQEFAVDWNGYNTITVSIRLLTTATYNNETFYPMIRLASITDDTYEPYHESVEQTLRDANLVNGKNEADISDTEKTFTLLKSGERTRYIYLNKEISAGNKILSIKISNASNMSLALRYQLLYNSTQVTSGNLGSTNNGVYNLPVNITSTINRLYFFISDSDNNNATCTVSDLMISTEGGAYEPYYIPLKDVVPNKCDNSIIAPVENGATASKSYSAGRGFIHNGEFRVTKTNGIASGETIDNNNSEVKTIEEQLAKNIEITVTGATSNYTLVQKLLEHIFNSEFALNTKYSGCLYASGLDVMMYSAIKLSTTFARCEIVRTNNIVLGQANNGTYAVNECPTANIPKSDTFSGTTGTDGNLKILDGITRHIVGVNAQGAIYIPFQTSTDTYLKVTNYDLTPKASTPVSGTYYYI